MIEKLFRLNPQSSWDLEELSYSFQEGPASVKKIDDFYWLVLQFDSKKPDEQAIDEARSTLARMSAICLVQNERFRTPTIAGIAERDPDTGKIGVTRLSAQIRIVSETHMRVVPTVTEADGTVRPRQPTFAEQAFRIAETNEPLREALRTYVTVEHQWPALYRVFETIKKANGGVIPTTWATPCEVDDFKQTANNPGDDPTARHGFDPTKAKQPRMTIAQGRALIQKILVAWINELISANNNQAP